MKESASDDGDSPPRLPQPVLTTVGPNSPASYRKRRSAWAEWRPIKGTHVEDIDFDVLDGRVIRVCDLEDPDGW